MTICSIVDISQQPSNLVLTASLDSIVGYLNIETKTSLGFWLVLSSLRLAMAIGVSLSNIANLKV